MRRDPESGTEVLVVCNFTPTVHEHYRIGVPRAGRYEERLNTDSRFYGGSDVGSPFGVVVSENEPSHGRPCSVMLRLPPLATVFYEYRP